MTLQQKLATYFEAVYHITGYTRLEICDAEKVNSELCFIRMITVHYFFDHWKEYSLQSKCRCLHYYRNSLHRIAHTERSPFMQSLLHQIEQQYLTIMNAWKQPCEAFHLKEKAA